MTGQGASVRCEIVTGEVGRGGGGGSGVVRLDSHHSQSGASNTPASSELFSGQPESDVVTAVRFDTLLWRQSTNAKCKGYKFSGFRGIRGYTAITVKESWRF